VEISHEAPYTVQLIFANLLKAQSYEKNISNLKKVGRNKYNTSTLSSGSTVFVI
jgi:hypothetical protein